MFEANNIVINTLKGRVMRHWWKKTKEVFSAANEKFVKSKIGTLRASF
nr:unnamed protein product [Callosobruchus analis]